MNADLQNFARSYLKEKIRLLPDNNKRVFKLMYGRNNRLRSVDEAVAMDINAVIDEIPPDKLDWAMQQIKRTLSDISRSCST